MLEPLGDTPETTKELQTHGHARRAGDLAVGAVVGKALEPLVEGRGVVEILVMLW